MDVVCSSLLFFFFFFFQALNFLVESFGLLTDLFPLPTIWTQAIHFLSSFGRCPV